MLRNAGMLEIQKKNSCSSMVEHVLEVSGLIPSHIMATTHKTGTSKLHHLVLDT